MPLGSEDGRIPDPMFRTSSSYNYYCAARNARLHQRRAGRNGGAWCSRTRNKKQWLQVDFGTDTLVTRVSTQGRHNADQWVTSYYVSFSSRGQRFITYKEGRRTKVCHELLFMPTPQLLTTSNFIGPWYHAALLFSGLGSIVLLFGVLFSQQIREDLVRAATSPYAQCFTVLC